MFSCTCLNPKFIFEVQTDVNCQGHSICVSRSGYIFSCSMWSMQLQNSISFIMKVGQLLYILVQLQPILHFLLLLISSVYVHPLLSLRRLFDFFYYECCYNNCKNISFMKSASWYFWSIHHGQYIAFIYVHLLDIHVTEQKAPGCSSVTIICMFFIQCVDNCHQLPYHLGYMP